MEWVMLIISTETGRVNATIPYQTRADCEAEIPLALKGNFPGTVRIECRPALIHFAALNFLAHSGLR